MARIEPSWIRTVKVLPKSWSSKPKKWQAAALAGQERPTKKPDGDNVLKAIADALNEIVYIDDAQIVDATVRKFYAAVPRTIVQITEINAGGIFG